MKLLAMISIDPADLRTTSRARRNLPGPAGEPRERDFGWTEVDAPGRRVEAADVVHEAAGIDECVLVRARHLDAVIVVGDVMATYGAHEAALVAVGPIVDWLR